MLTRIPISDSHERRRRGAAAGVTATAGSSEVGVSVLTKVGATSRRVSRIGRSCKSDLTCARNRRRGALLPRLTVAEEQQFGVDALERVERREHLQAVG